MVGQPSPRGARVFFLFASLAGAAGCSCGGGTPPPDAGVDAIDVVPFARTIVLNDADRASLTSIAGRELRFAAPSDAVRAVAPLDVVVGGPSAAEPHGFLRLVVRTENDGDDVVWTTIRAPVQLAFERLHVRATRATQNDVAPVPAGEQALTVPGGGGITFPLGQPLFNVDDDDATAYDQVIADGALHGGLEYTFSIDFDWADVASGIDDVHDCLQELLTGGFLDGLIEGEIPCDPEELLPEVKTGLAFSAGATADVELSGVAFLGYSAVLPLYNQELPPIVIEPLVFTPHVRVEATFSGEASSQFSLTYHGEASGGGAIAYSTKHGLDHDGPDFDYDFTAGDIDTVLSSESTASVGPELSVLLYEIIGPTAGLKIGVRLTADRDASPCYHLFGTVDGTVGVYVGFDELPGFTLIDEKQAIHIADEEFASGDCVPFPPGGELDGHAGEPPLSAFQNPTFPRWGAAYADTVDGIPVEDLGAQVEWAALVPTIDGRFLFTGSDVEVLHSLNTDGDVVWAKRYTADVDFWDDLNSNKLLLSKAVPLPDATMLVVAHPYTLLHLDAAGALLSARRFAREPYRETWLRFTDAVQDGAGGVFVVGNVGESYAEAYLHDAWLLHLDEDLAVDWSRRIHDADGSLTARRLLPLDGDVLVVGDSARVATHARGVVARFTAAGQLAWATAVVSDDCAGQEQWLWLDTVIRSHDGDIQVGGGANLFGFEAFLAKVKPADGAMPWFATARAQETAHLGPMMTALVQLPTSGFLAAGNYAGQGTVGDVWLAGLDSAGGVQWARLLGGKNNLIDALATDDEYPTLVTTMDGAALIAGYSETVVTSEESTFVMKVPARDGEITFDDANLVSEPLALTSGGLCATSEPLVLSIADDAVAPLQPLTVFVDDVALAATSLGAQP